MQKAVTQMNIQLANVLGDGMRDDGAGDREAILAGERDPYQWAALRNWRVKACEEESARSLEGNWQEDVLFVPSCAGPMSVRNGRFPKGWSTTLTIALATSATLARRLRFTGSVRISGKAATERAYL
jgi:hypothetical protein